MAAQIKRDLYADVTARSLAALKRDEPHTLRGLLTLCDPVPQSAVIDTLARPTAMKAAKAQLRAQGRKVHHFTLRELTILAREYLDQHPELFAETWQRVKNAPELRELYDREMRDRQRKPEQNCKHLHSTRSVAAQGVSLCESQTQNGSVGDAK